MNFLRKAIQTLQSMQTTSAELQTHRQKSHVNGWMAECISHLSKQKHFMKKASRGTEHRKLCVLTNSQPWFCCEAKQRFLTSFRTVLHNVTTETTWLAISTRSGKEACLPAWRILELDLPSPWLHPPLRLTLGLRKVSFLVSFLAGDFTALK